MGEIDKEVLNRLKRLRADHVKMNEEITYCTSQLALIVQRITDAQLRNDYPLILTMSTELANQNTKLQSVTQSIVGVAGDIQQLLNNNPDIVKSEREAKKRFGMYGSMMLGDDIPRRAKRQPVRANRTTKPAPKKRAAPQTGAKRIPGRR